jgi:hypothetical protein
MAPRRGRLRQEPPRRRPPWRRLPPGPESALRHRIPLLRRCQRCTSCRPGLSVNLSLRSATHGEPIPVPRELLICDHLCEEGCFRYFLDYSLLHVRLPYESLSGLAAGFFFKLSPWGKTPHLNIFHYFVSFTELGTFIEVVTPKGSMTL